MRLIFLLVATLHFANASPAAPNVGTSFAVARHPTIVSHDKDPAWQSALNAQNNMVNRFATVNRPMARRAVAATAPVASPLSLSAVDIDTAERHIQTLIRSTFTPEQQARLPQDLWTWNGIVDVILGNSGAATTSTNATTHTTFSSVNGKIGVVPTPISSAVVGESEGEGENESDSEAHAAADIPVDIEPINADGVAFDPSHTPPATDASSALENNSSVQDDIIADPVLTSEDVANEPIIDDEVVSFNPVPVPVSNTLSLQSTRLVRRADPSKLQDALEEAEAEAQLNTLLKMAQTSATPLVATAKGPAARPWAWSDIFATLTGVLNNKAPVISTVVPAHTNATAAATLNSTSPAVNVTASFGAVNSTSSFGAANPTSSAAKATPIAKRDLSSETLRVLETLEKEIAVIKAEPIAAEQPVIAAANHTANATLHQGQAVANVTQTTASNTTRHLLQEFASALASESKDLRELSATNPLSEE